MRVTIVAFGTRGDVQPYVALGRGLQAVGHSVCIATQVKHHALVRAHGLDVASVEGDPRETLEAQGQAVLDDKSTQVWRQFVHLSATLMTRRVRDLWEQCRDSDAFLFTLNGYFAAYVAEKLDVPALGAFLYPVSPTRAFPHSFRYSGLHAVPGYNALSYSVGGQIFWQHWRRGVNDARRDVLGLPPIGAFQPFGQLYRRRIPFLYGYSPTLLPKPADWAEWLNVCGYWFLEGADEYQPPDSLRAFLEDGPPPVYIGFGSMNRNNSRPEDVIEMIVAALDATKQRGVVAMEWEGLDIDTRSLPDTIYKLGAAPHDWLFPRMAAVVHHGGAGTTAEGLRAGVPSIVVPYAFDQPFWGWCVHASGAGPRPIPRKKLTHERLSNAIRAAVYSSALRRRAAEVGAAIRAEDGVASAVAAFDRYARQGGFAAAR